MTTAAPVVIDDAFTVSYLRGELSKATMRHKAAAVSVGEARTALRVAYAVESDASDAVVNITMDLRKWEVAE